MVDKSTPEAVKKLWMSNENPEAREEYLFDAIISLKETLCKEFKTHQHICKRRYVTRRQAMVVGIVVFAVVVGIVIGTGYLTIPELIKTAVGKI